MKTKTLLRIAATDLNRFAPQGLRFTPWSFQRAICEMADRAHKTPSEVYSDFLSTVQAKGKR